MAEGEAMRIYHTHLFLVCFKLLGSTYAYLRYFFLHSTRSQYFQIKINMLRTVIDQTVRTLSSASKSFGSCRRLEGKVAIVTASTQGIGFSVARRLAQEGAKVVISSRKEANVKNAVDELRNEGLDITGITCHVGKAEDRQKLLNEAVAKYGGLDILVPNAAANPEVGTVFSANESIWDKIFEINVKCTFLLMKESLPLLKKSKSSAIVMMSSIAGYHPYKLSGVYSVSKTALISLCKATADELAQDGIRVNCIAPGIIKTKLSKPIHENEALLKILLPQIPMRRLGNTNEIASITAFLASDDASYITGETIVAGGGAQSRL